MEQSAIHRKNLIGGATFGLFVLFLFFFTFGCGSKDKGGGAANPNGAFVIGGAGYGGGVVSRVGAATDMNGQYRVIIAAIAQQGYTGGGFYSGPAVFEGQFNLRAGIGCPLTNFQTGINPGVYQLVPTGQPGMVQLDLFSGAQFLMRGAGFEAIVQVPLAQVSSVNYCGSPYQGMFGGLNIVQVNGYPCGIYTTFTDQNNMCN